MNTIVLKPEYFASVDYYAALARAPRAVIDRSIRYDKRAKEVHRCEIADTRGRVMLTVPVSKGSDHICQWEQMVVSAHDWWWERHITTLESAYGRTPFFEFYIDRFLPLIGENVVGHPIVDIDIEIDRILRETLLIDTEVTYDASVVDPTETTDYRRSPLPDAGIGPYWQIRSDRLGFEPRLSILDLLFSLGPEAALVLHGHRR